MGISSILNRIKKGVRDIGSGAKDIIKNNPEALMIAAAMFGIPALMGKTGTTGGGFMDWMKKFGGKALGSFSGKNQVYDSALGKMVGGTDASGLLGLGQTAGKFLGKEGIVSLITSFLAKKQFDKEREDALAERARLEAKANIVSDKFGSPLGGSPFLEGKFEQLVYDPKTDRRYDYYDRDTDEYKDYEVDEEGRVIVSAKGGIAQLKTGGFGGPGRMPFNPNNKIRGILNAPILNRAIGGEIFDPRLSGNQMMNIIEDNPGITQFFPPKFGEIRGPGGPREDKIPAMLSDGEFVMTAKAVDNAGGPKAMYNLMNKLDPKSSQGKGIV
jgi:hypothetical protein